VAQKWSHYERGGSTLSGNRKEYRRHKFYMKLKHWYATLDEIPEAYRALYVEKDGKFFLEVEGMVPKARLDEFRDKNTKLLKRLDALNAVVGSEDENLEHIQELLEKEKSGDLTIGKGKSKEDVERLVTERVATMKADYEKKIADLTKSNGTFQTQLEKAVIETGLTQAATKRGVRTTAIEDILSRGRGVYKLVDGVPVPMKGDERVFGKDGITPKSFDEFIEDLATAAPHLFAENQGSGATGSARAGFAYSGTNPWNPKTLNLTEQGRILRTQPELAARLKKEHNVA